MAEIESSNPYAYLERADFTSELFKIEIKNLHCQVGFGQIKKKLASLNLKPHKVKIVGLITFVTFKTAVDRDVAISKLNGYVWKGHTLIVKIAKGRADPCLMKRQADQEADTTPENKKAKVEANMDPEERLRDVVTKLWRKPYGEQLKEKHIETKKLLSRLFHKLIRENPTLQKHLKPIDDYHGQLACELLDIVPSPVEKCYRNKCEFTIGEDLDGNGPIVGFRYGKYRGGLNAVGSPHSVDLMPESMARGVRRVQDFLTIMAGGFEGGSVPPLRAFTMEDLSGHWRTATLRVNRAEQVMLLLDLHPQDLTQEHLRSLEEAMLNYFIEGDGKDANIRSLFIVTRPKSADVLDSTTAKRLYGDDFITESVNGINFQVSYNAFFQVNTRAAEILYQKIGELCELTEDTILLDVCSGTGTIGLAMAKYVEKVIGVEICEEAVLDARKNATENGIKNANFLIGSAQDLIPSVLIDLPPKKPVVAIVDPPRAGLPSSVIVALRRCPQLNTLLYVSCNPAAAFNNLVEFGRLESNRLRGDPIIPVRAVDFDLFPQTNHVELVMLMKRVVRTPTLSRETTQILESFPVIPMTTSSIDSAISMVSALGQSQNTDATMTSLQPSVDSVVSMKSIGQSQDSDVTMVSVQPSLD